MSEIGLQDLIDLGLVEKVRHDQFFSIVPSKPKPPSFFLKALAHRLLTFLSGSTDLSGEQQALFFSTTNQDSVIAVDFLPDAVTNYQVFGLADAIQRLNHPLFNINGAASYYQRLALYMRYVDSRTDDSRVVPLREKMLDAGTRKDSEWQRVAQAYATLPPTLPGQIVPTLVGFAANDKEYMDAVANEQACLLDYKHVLPSELQAVADQLKIIRSAGDRAAFQVSANMPCYPVGIDIIQDAYRNQANGGKVPMDQNNIYYQPSCMLPSYRFKCRNWFDKNIKLPRQTYSIDLDADSLRDLTWAQLGHTDLDEQYDQTYIEKAIKLLPLIKAELTVLGEAATETVKRNLWDVSPLEYTLAETAPPMLQQQFVKTTSVLLAYGLEINITLPTGLDQATLSALKVSSWGLPLYNVDKEGRQLMFKSGGDFSPRLLAVLGTLVGGST